MLTCDHRQHWRYAAKGFARPGNTGEVKVIHKLSGATRILLVTLAMVAVITPAASAVTKDFATTSSPLSTTGYGSTAKSYGTWTIEDRGYGSTYTAIWANYKYTDAADHTVFSTVNVSVTLRSNGSKFSRYLETSHDNTVTAAWTVYREQDWSDIAMSSSGLADATGNAKVCLDVPWRTDPCTSKTITTSF